MDTIELLIDLHKHAKRQGPGSETETIKALNMANISSNQPLKIADIGCGTGASTLTLAKELNAHITAVDLLVDFLTILKERAHQENRSDVISTLQCPMDDLPFQNEEFDVIWSEGAIYNMGFEKGVRDWKQYLKMGGHLVLSEITWLTESRPKEIQEYWEKQYPEIDVASAKIKILEEQGYSPIGYFSLPKSCWLDQYYLPLENAFQSFLERHQNSTQAYQIIEEEKEEIALYKKYSDFYSYGMYICRKVH